jgi:hypothetical protein
MRAVVLRYAAETSGRAKRGNNIASAESGMWATAAHGPRERPAGPETRSERVIWRVERHGRVQTWPFLTTATMSSRKPSGSKQTVVSHYFQKPARNVSLGKRESSPIDLTLSDDDSRPTKKPKTMSHSKQPLFLPDSQAVDSFSPQSAGSHLPPRSPTIPASQRWRYDPSATQTSPQRTREQEELLQSTRARLSRKLVKDSSSSRRSKEPMEAESSEAGSSAAESDGESDGQFRQLQEMFAMSGRGKGKAKARVRVAAPVKKAKKGEEIGPSGLAYTPLELQVHALFILRRLSLTCGTRLHS